MATSAELKRRLRGFLSDPSGDEEFRYWFASLLTQQNDPDVEGLAQEIHLAFADAASGAYAPEELKTFLAELAKEAEPTPTPNVYVISYRCDSQQQFDPLVDTFQTSGISASGAFYGPTTASPQLSGLAKAQLIAWETLVVQASGPAGQEIPAASA